MNARNDARAVAEALTTLGYTVTLAVDVDRTALGTTIEVFASSIVPGDTVVIYYAGHGLQVDGENYLVPTDFHVADAADAKAQGYGLSVLLEKVVAHGAVTQVIVLDACRDNPFHSMRGLHGGWARTATSAGSFLAFGTSPGSTASDDPREKHGLFTQALLRHIADPSLDIEALFRKVRLEVIRSSDNEQVPWTASSLVGMFHMVPASDESAPILGGVQMRTIDTDGDRRRSLSTLEPKRMLVPSSSEEEMLAEASGDLRSFHLDAALRVLNTLLSLHPTSAAALKLLSVVLHLCGRGAEATELLRSVLLANPRDYQAYAYRCLMTAGHDVAASSNDCRAAIEINDEYGPAHLGLAINLLSTGSDDAAYKEVNRAISLDPSSAAGFTLRGKVLAARGDVRAAETDYSHADLLAVPQ